MKTLNLSAIFSLFFYVSLAQVGINNTNPKAMLDITANDAANPANTDGLLIPRIDEFPTDLTADQNGMLVFITGNGPFGIPAKGFYFWNWDSGSGTGDWNIATSKVKNINDLEDGKSDNDGSSLFLGIGAGAVDGGDNKNVGVGFNSLNANTTGDNNTAIGHNSLIENTGGNNTAIGYAAGANNTTGSNNVYLGKEAGSSATNESNKLYINNAESANPLIYGEFDDDILGFNGKVGINNQAPNASLEITASDAANPISTDGILIPRVDDLAAVAVMEADQDGMMVFATGDGSDEKGFYFYDHTATAWKPFVRKINDLEDGKSDNDGTQNGSSLFLGIGAGAVDDGNDNKNVGVGFNSLAVNEDGNNNTAIGYNSLAVNEDGNNNTAIGYNSLAANEDGNNNTAIGHNSLIANEDGIGNTAIGDNSLIANESGEENTAVGQNSLINNENGSRNVSLGTNTLNAMESGDNNVAIGDSAGFGVVSGSNNIFLGKHAGDVLVGGDDVDDLNYRLYIANSDGDDPLVYGKFGTINPTIAFNAAVGINNYDPEYDLHIKQIDNDAEGPGGIVLDNANDEKWKIYVTDAGDLGFAEFNGTTEEFELITRMDSDERGINLTGRVDDATVIIRSDIRLKKNIGLLSSALTNILGLKAYQYNYKEESDTDKKSMGFMAQDIQKIYPELVEDIGGGFLGVNYTGFGVLAIKAIQEQQVQIEQQQQEIDELKEKIEYFTLLEKRIEALERASHK